MIVCLIARRIWTHGLGGLEEHCRAITAGLALAGHTVHVLTTAHPDGRATESAYGGTLHYLSGTPPGDYSPRFWRESRRWARDNFPRLGIQATLSMSIAAYGLVGLDGPPIFTIITGWGFNQLRSYWHDMRGWRRLVDLPRTVLWLLLVLPKGRRLLRASERVFAVSHEIERQLRRYRASYLPNFVETSLFRPDPLARSPVRARLGLADDDCVALMVSTITWQKGVHLGLRACAAVARAHPALAAVVVGGGPAAALIEAEARRKAPHLRLAFVGALPHDDLPPFYAAADVFLLPSLRQEGLPTTVLEAMSAGVPVVAMRAGGTPTAVAHGETGLLVPLGSVPAFTEALLALVTDPDRRRAMGRAGRERVIREFDRDVVIRRLVEILGGAPC